MGPKRSELDDDVYGAREFGATDVGDIFFRGSSSDNVSQSKDPSEC